MSAESTSNVEVGQDQSADGTAGRVGQGALDFGGGRHPDRHELDL